MSFLCYVLLPHGSDTKILFVPAEGQGEWTLPYVSTPDMILRRVGMVGAAFQEKYGPRVSVMRYLSHADSPTDDRSVTVFACEDSDPGESIPEHARWAGPDEMAEIPLTPPELREIVQEWFDTREGRKPAPSGLPPWMHSGWHGEVSEWIDARLDSLGIRRTGPIEKDKGWGISTHMQVPTSAGMMVYKASPDFFRQEPVITHALSQIYPDHSPRVIALDPERNGMLMEWIEGISLWDAKGEDAGLAALRRFARIQIDMASRTEEMLRWGCMNRPLNTLPGEMDRLWNAIQVPEDEKLYTLSPAEVEAVLPLKPRLLDLYETVSASGLPDTLIHGDLHGGNIMVAGDRTVFFDWSDAALAPPFFDLVMMMGREDPECRARRIEAYLEPWTEEFSMAALKKAFEPALTLAFVYHALSYLYLTDSMAPPLKWEMGDGVGDNLRELLKELDALPPSDQAV